MPPALPIIDLEVPPDAFPFLVVAVLTVARTGEYDFSFDPLITLRPATGRLGIDGPDVDRVTDAVRGWLAERNVPLTALPRA